MMESQLITGRDGMIYFHPDVKRFGSVAEKIAAGLCHAEESLRGMPSRFTCIGLFHSRQLPEWVSDLMLKRRSATGAGWPEVGSRAFERAVMAAVGGTQPPAPTGRRSWITVQDGIFDFMFRSDPDRQNCMLCLMRFHHTAWALVRFRLQKVGPTR
jgi:hypothetical protein